MIINPSEMKKGKEEEEEEERKTRQETTKDRTLYLHGHSFCPGRGGFQHRRVIAAVISGGRS